MTPNYYHQFLQAFYNELLGRYAHLQTFVERTRLETGTKSPKLLEVYSQQLDSRINELLDHAEDLWHARSAEIDPAYLIRLFNGLKNESGKFQKLHRTLRWFSAPWPEAEVFEFLDHVFEERGLRKGFEKLNPSIVFSDEYNFLTYDVGYIPKGVSRAGLTAWAIPKSESTNPLLWSLLVHEVAHSYFDESSLVNFISRAFHGRASNEQMELIRLWARELNADLFGFKCLGPAYLCSLMYLSMFFVVSDVHQPLQTNSRSFHPPPYHRVNLLLKEAPPPTLIDGVTTSNINTVLGVFDELFKVRSFFDTEAGFEASDYSELYLSPATLEHLWRVLKQFQEKYCPDLIAFNNDFTPAFELSRRLDDRILAGSLRDSFDRETIRKFLARPRAASREQALVSLNERPATMFEVMNAGWMNKVRERSWKLPVFDEIAKGEERQAYLPKLLNSLTEPARQLQMSIQVALVLPDMIQPLTLRRDATE